MCICLTQVVALVMIDAKETTELQVSIPPVTSTGFDDPKEVTTVEVTRTPIYQITEVK